MSETERRNLKNDAPLFLFRNRRKIWKEELDQGVIEILDLEVRRAWPINVCTCCANSYLFQVGAEKYLYGESKKLTKFAFTSGEFPKRRLKIERLPLTKKILKVEVSGDYIPTEEQIEPYEFLNYGECEILEKNQMSSEELQSKIHAI